MEHQIERMNHTTHDLFVDGQLFNETKLTERIHDVVNYWHTRQIGDDASTLKWYAVVRTDDKDGQTIKESIRTFPEDLDIDSFKTEWESAWNPTLVQKSTGVFSSLKNWFSKFW